MMLNLNSTGPVRSPLRRGSFSGAVLAFLAGFSVLIACEGKQEEKKEPVDLTKFSGLYVSYFLSCKECHEPNNIVYTENVPNLDMSSEDAAYNSLVSTANLKRLAGAGCAPAKYVEAGSTARSVLYAILDAPTADAFAGGLCKPLKHAKADGGVANDPTPEQKQKIKEWIEKGAPRN